MKKRRIRHLEFYGYPDQNVYIGLPNIDLSDIREVNREQDKEIDAISGATRDKADISIVNELSGKVDTFIDRQSEINEILVSGLSKNSEAINNLEIRDEEITNTINDIVDEVDALDEKMDAVSAHTDDIDARLTQHLDESGEFEQEITERVENLENELEDKLGKDEAEDTYAKKEDVYNKEEIDEMISSGIGTDYATKAWVLEQDYITETDADLRYASKTTLDALNERVTTATTELNNQYAHLNADLIRFSATTNVNIDNLNNRVTNVEQTLEREIANLEDEDERLRILINQNADDIARINNISLPSKADKQDLNDLSTEVTNLSVRIDNKVDQDVYDDFTYRTSHKLDVINDKLEDLDDKKADKTDLDDINDRIDQERDERISGDTELSNRIDGLNSDIENIREGDVTINARIGDLEDGLAQEILDRKAGDTAIIGTPSDVQSDNTIYGAKKYADYVSSQALADAQDYADIKDGEVVNYVDDVKEELNRKITAKADKAYVDATKIEINSYVDDKVAEERERAEGAEGALTNAIMAETNRAVEHEQTISTALTHTSNIVKALTDWDGDDRESYIDTGDGIVDVMHRKLHQIETLIPELGEGIITTNPNEVGFGSYNVSTTGEDPSEQTAFSVGVGTSSSDRKNAIELRKNGDVYMWIEGDYVKVNDIIAMLTNESY